MTPADQVAMVLCLLVVVAAVVVWFERWTRL